MATVKYSESTVLKAGVYPVKVASVDEDDGQFGPQFKFIFDITSGKAAGQQQFGWASQKLSPKSKLLDWVKALLPDQDVGPKFVLDTDWLIDCEARMVLSVELGKDGNERNRIDSLLPLEDEEEEAAAPAPARQVAAPMRVERGPERTGPPARSARPPASLPSRAQTTAAVAVAADDSELPF